jgi:hypothetical protein
VAEGGRCYIPCRLADPAVSTTIARRGEFQRFRPAAALTRQGVQIRRHDVAGIIKTHRPEPFTPAAPSISTPPRADPIRPSQRPQEGRQSLTGIFPAPNRLKALLDALTGLETVLKAEVQMSKRVAELTAAVADVDSPRSGSRHGNRPGHSSSRHRRMTA